MGYNKYNYEVRQENADAVWSALSAGQKKALLNMLEAWLPVRNAMEEIMAIDYEALKRVDTCWYHMKHNFVGSDVVIEEDEY
jgi:hypothetical protein|tara:strand:- start:366 stop:611 length:246 start_codon:yes stop_codon:yes gene_type:complete